MEITADQIKEIVQGAVTEALKPFDDRYTALEHRIATVEKSAVTSKVVQEMIDVPFNTLNSKVQEALRLFLGWDVSLRNVEQSLQRSIASSESMVKASERMEKRIDELDKRLDDEERCRIRVEGEITTLNHDLFGDPARKDDNPSIMALIQELPGKVTESMEQALRPRDEQLAALTSVVNDHTQFIERRRKAETRVKEAGAYVLKLPLWQKIALVSGSGVLALVIRFLETLSGQ